MAENIKISLVKVGEYRFKVRSEHLDRFKEFHPDAEVVGGYELQAGSDPVVTIETQGALASEPDTNVQSKDDKKRTQASKKD